MSQTELRARDESDLRRLQHGMYAGEHEGEICFHFYSKEEIAHRGRDAIEHEMAREHTWWEELGELDGHLGPDDGVTFLGSDMEKLVLRCSRKLVPIEESVDFEYRATEWGPSN